MEHLKTFAIATASVIVGIAIYNNVVKQVLPSMK